MVTSPIYGSSETCMLSLSTQETFPYGAATGGSSVGAPPRLGRHWPKCCVLLLGSRVLGFTV